ncbi:MAG: pyridoxal phosphate-dependent aminotransferase [bacterium]|nr:pyridoxal phosphate-dependent aminotransferase [bacterium]
MMTSKRSNRIEPSITMAVSNLAQDMKRNGENVIGFGAGEPDFDTPDHIKAAGIKAIQDGKTKYTAATGLVELKQAIADKLRRDQGLEYALDAITVNCGAKHSVYNVMAAIVDPGDEVIIPAPYWVSYPEQVKLVDGESVILNTGPESHFKITAEQLEAAITPKSKLLIMNSPSNPTGMVYSREELQAIADVVVKHGIYVLSDEIYEDLLYDGAEHVSIAELGDAIRELTVIVNGVSKAYSMTGWRIGYTASNVSIAKAIARMQSHTTSNPTSISQWAAIEALSGDQEPVQEMLRAFATRRTLILELLNEIDGIECLAPQGAFYAFPTISGWYGKTAPTGPITDSVSFCEHLLKGAKVAAVPGIGFGQDDCMRLSYASSEATIREGIGRIKAWVDTLV